MHMSLLPWICSQHSCNYQNYAFAGAELQLCSFTGAAGQVCRMKALTLLPRCVFHWNNTPVNFSFSYKNVITTCFTLLLCGWISRDGARDLKWAPFPCQFIVNFPSRAILRQFRGLVFLSVLHQFKYFSYFFLLSPYFLVASIWWLFILPGCLLNVCRVVFFFAVMLFFKIVVYRICFFTAGFWVCSGVSVGLLFINLGGGSFWRGSSMIKENHVTKTVT